MNTQHTPGPWKATASLQKWHVTTTNPPRTFNICTVSTDRVEQTANAYLIAAAPELLAALKVAKDFAGKFADTNTTPAFSDFGELWLKMDKAIAKAEGRS